MGKAWEGACGEGLGKSVQGRPGKEGVWCVLQMLMLEH